MKNLLLSYLFFLFLNVLSAQDINPNNFNLVDKENTKKFKKSAQNINDSDLFISEVADPGDEGTARFIELYNSGSTAIVFGSGDYYLSIKYQDGTWVDQELSGQINASSCFVIARNSGYFYFEYGFSPDISNASFSGNGDDGYYLFQNGDHSSGTLIDSYGDMNTNDGTGEAWEYQNTKAVRIGSVTEANPVWDSTEWHIPDFVQTRDMTPGVHKASVTWLGSTTYWNYKSTSNWSGTNGYIPDASFDVSISDQTNQPTITKESAVNDLTINSGVLTLGADKTLRVYGSLTCSDTSRFILEADVNGPSSLIHQSNGVKAQVISYFNDYGNDEWYLVSPPISDGLASVFLDQYLDYWDEVNSTWESIEDENTLLIQGMGYSLQKDLAHRANYSGTLNSGDVTINGLTLTNNNASFGDGWNLVGNPYPSVLDISKLDFGENIVASANVWVHGSSGPYKAWSQGGGGDIEARYIQPGQGFMIQLTSDDQNLTFTNSARTNYGLDSFDKENPDQFSSSLKISISDQSGRSDNTYISLNEDANLYFDPYFDSHKLFGGSENPYIYSYINIEEDERAAIQSIPPPNEGDVIHLGTKLGQPGEYNLVFSGLNSFNSQYEFYLLDKKLDKIVHIELDSSYIFNYESGDALNRFDLVLDLSTTSEIISEDLFNCYYTSDYLFIHLSDEKTNDYDINIYNILGQQVYNSKIDHNSVSGIPINLSIGTYIVRLESDNQTYVKKLVFK